MQLPQRFAGLSRLVILASGLAACAQAAPRADYPPVTPPPASFFELVRDRDREAARQFYKKFIDVKGMPVVAAGEVADLALQRTYDIVVHLLTGRPDILRAMVTNGMYLIVIGKDQVYTDMPEYRNHPNPAYQNERVRGTGGKPTSFGEENLLSLPLDRYDDESIGVHEFCHTVDGTLRSLDPTWSERKNAVYRKAMDKGLWKNTYAASNPGEYWAEICQSYFDCNRVNNWNHGPIGTREQLKDYDPDGYELVRTTFRLNPDQDWRYTFLQKQPSVTAPPAKFAIAPYYTKFTWAREFTVLGRQARDDALLQANDTIRKMFAYRHDILKALIADGVKLVVLGRDEKISDLPEHPARQRPKGFDPRARVFEYAPETKLLVVAEENVLGESAAARNSDSQVIRVFAHALYHVTGTRPVDPDWESRPRNVWQQYELRVQRLDARFDQRLKTLHEQAVNAGKWKGTPAVSDRVAYWVAGVLAYFDAAGGSNAPSDAPQPVRTREALLAYDPGLYALVHETMAYEGRADWRYRR
jgi:alpha-glucosidase